MDLKAMQAELESLRASNAALKAASQGRITLKASIQGGVSVYGMGRFPVTLFKDQWIKLLDQGENIRQFIATNGDALSSGKDDPRFADARAAAAAAKITR